MRTPKPVQERRRSVHISESLPFKIGHQGYETEAVTVNISTTGSLCLVHREVPLMTQLKVAVSLPAAKSGSKKKTLTMKGVVVRRDRDEANDRYLIAIYFSEIKPGDRTTLEKFIESRLSANA